MLICQLITGIILLGPWGAAEPALAGSRTWRNQKGVTRMSNVETLFPERNKVEVSAIRPSPAPGIREKVLTKGGETMSEVESEDARVRAVVENLADRNRKVLELKGWVEKIIGNPGLLQDQAFVEWIGGIMAQQLPAPSGTGQH